MKKIILLLAIFFSGIAFSQIQFIDFPNGAKYGALFPCSAKPASINSAIGITSALRCRKESSSSICDFLIAEQPLDIESYNKYGFKFIEDVHQQYAKQIDPNHVNKGVKIVSEGALGKKLNYELTRRQDGMDINVKGSWFVYSNRMMRITVSCAPENTKYLINEREQFLNSPLIYK